MGAMLPWERSLGVLHGCSDIRRSRGLFQALKHEGAEEGKGRLQGAPWRSFCASCSKGTMPWPPASLLLELRPKEVPRPWRRGARLLGCSPAMEKSREGRGQGESWGVGVLPRSFCSCAHEAEGGGAAAMPREGALERKVWAMGGGGAMAAGLLPVRWREGREAPCASPWTAEGGRRNMLAVVVVKEKEKETGKEKVAARKVRGVGMEKYPKCKRGALLFIENC
jgi:hypothetical protein